MGTMRIMDIKYLTAFTQHPSFTNTNGIVDTLQPISSDEIAELESSYNNGNPFPVVLTELLYLAGDYCYVLDYGATDSQDDIQQTARDLLTENNQEITRPFYVVDMYGGSQFLFVYLDEGKDDPSIYEAQPYTTNGDLLRATGQTLASLINRRIVRLLSGYSVF
jgi:hypothetical protein